MYLKILFRLGFPWLLVTNTILADSVFDPSTNTIAPDAFMSAVVVGSGGDTFAGVVAKYQKAGNMFVSASGDVYIYS